MSKALEAASDRIREMIPQMSVWFPSMEQGDALARACVAAYLRAVGEVDGVIFKRAETAITGALNSHHPRTRTDVAATTLCAALSALEPKDE